MLSEFLFGTRHDDTAKSQNYEGIATYPLKNKDFQNIPRGGIKISTHFNANALPLAIGRLTGLPIKQKKPQNLYGDWDTKKVKWY